jgi:hypothetical protein
MARRSTELPLHQIHDAGTQRRFDPALSQEGRLYATSLRRVPVKST